MKIFPIFYCIRQCFFLQKIFKIKKVSSCVVKVTKMELTYLQGPEILYYSLYRPFATTTVSQLNISDIFHGKSLKILKCYNFVRVQRRHNCSPAASFVNCVMTLYLLKKCICRRFFLYQKLKNAQILNCDTFVVNGRYEG